VERGTWMPRFRHWWRVIRAGFWTVPTVVSYVILIVGGSVALTFTWGRKHLLWAIVLVLIAIIVVTLEGSYRESRRAEDEHLAALAAQRSEHERVLSAALETREAARKAEQIRAFQYGLAIRLEGRPAMGRSKTDDQPEPGYAFTVDLQNTTAQAIRWEMESYVITMDGGYTARPGQDWGSTNGFIPPNSSTPLYYHWLPAPTQPLLGGIGDLTVLYSHPANGPDGPRFRTHQRFSISWTEYPGQVPQAHMVIQGIPTHDPVETTSQNTDTTA
jgi:hypothetical protein